MSAIEADIASKPREVAKHIAVEEHSQELQQRIVRFLATRGIHGLENVQIKADGGTVILQGRIATSHDRWLCVNCSQRVAGVLEVVDELHVDAPTTTVKRPK